MTGARFLPFRSPSVQLQYWTGRCHCKLNAVAQVAYCTWLPDYYSDHGLLIVGRTFHRLRLKYGQANNTQRNEKVKRQKRASP